MPDEDQIERRKGARFGREIAWGIAIPAATLGLSAAIWVSDFSMDIHHQLAVHDARLSSVDRYIEEHRREADQWVSRIRDNAKDCNECKRSVAALETRAGARADPFTGSEGAAMSARIDAIERLIMSMK